MSTTGQTSIALAGELPTPEEAKEILQKLANPFLRTGDTQAWSVCPPSTTFARGDVSRFQYLESLFGSLSNALPDPLIVVNREGLIVLANAQTAEMFGYEAKELLGRPLNYSSRRASEGSTSVTATSISRSPRKRPMGAFMKLFGLRKDGSEFPVEVSLNPLPTSEGILVVSTVRDISDRVRLEKRYRTLIEGIPAVTFMAALDAGFSELYVSPQIENLLGFSQQEWLEDPLLWYRQLHRDDKARWHGEFAQTCATGEVFRAEYRFVARDGRVVWVLGEAKVVRGEDGRPLFMQGIAFDITPMKQAEEQLRAHEQDLKRLVAERTAELEEKRRQLEEKVKDLKDFTQFAAHEMKKPLRPIVGELSPTEEPLYLTKGRNLAPVREMAAWVLARVKDALDRLEAMKRWARVEERQLKRLTAYDCRVVFATACKMLKDTIAETGAKVASGPLPMVMAAQPDESCSELDFLFENLINNALKYRSPDRRPRVRVEAQRLGGQWQFSFRDNGIGIESKHFDGSADNQIWNMFDRLHGERIPGYGIGLAYCKRVVESLSGKIWVESTVGKGSTFFFTLPALTDDRAVSPLLPLAGIARACLLRPAPYRAI